MQAVILAAGKGLRLRPFTEHHPKPLIPIAGKPLLEYTLNALPDSITEIIIVTGYLSEQIIEHFGTEWQSKPIRYVTQTELLGTGDAITRAKEFLKDHFLVVNGDDLYTKKDLTRLLDYPNSILAWESTMVADNGLDLSTDGQLIGFNVKSKLVNCGAYHLTTDFFSVPLFAITVHDATEYSLPHTLVELSKQQPVQVVTATHWFPVGTPLQLQFANDYYIKKHLNS